MPARHYILVILAFWLATSSLLFYRDLRPQLWPGPAPPFTIDLADEASIKIVPWTVLKKGPKGKYHDKGYAKTGVSYREADDTFEVWGLFKLWSRDRKAPQPDQVVDSKYRVTPGGELREVVALVTLTVLGDIKIQGQVAGKVENGRFIPHFRITGPGIDFSQDLDSVEVSMRGSVLNPLQPLNRLPELRLGQHWRMPLIDPLTDAIAAATKAIPAFKGKAAEMRYLEAEVLPKTQILPRLLLERDLPRAGGDVCLVIEYVGDDINARSWVRESDGLVLRQEVTDHGDNLILDRD